MPVDTAQSLESEHAAGTSGKCLVIENLLEKRLQGLLRLFEFDISLYAVVVGDLRQACVQIAAIGQIAVKAIDTVGVLLYDPPVFARQQKPDQRDCFDPFPGNAVLFQVAR